MKNLSKLFRLVAVATILCLLVVALPATVHADEEIELDPESGAIGDNIEVTGSGFRDSTETTDYRVYLYMSPEEFDEGDDVEDLDTFHRVGSDYTDDDGDIDTDFNIPSRLTTGSDDG